MIMRKLNNNTPMRERRAGIERAMRELDQLFRKPEKNNAAAHGSGQAAIDRSCINDIHFVPNSITKGAA